jgi:leader peptidase (prepilin peptidase)/N-methyltransferase
MAAVDLTRSASPSDLLPFRSLSGRGVSQTGPELIFRRDGRTFRTKLERRTITLTPISIWWVATAVAAAPFFGSFLALAAMRWGGPEPILVGRSRCDSCRRVLSPSELLPLVSYVVQRGRCRSCGARIALFHPAMEIAALIVALLSAVFMPPQLVWISAALGWTLLLLAAIDLRTWLLPDALTLPLIVAGLLFALLLREDVWVFHAAGAAGGWAGMAALAFLYEKIAGRAGLGGGDVKLFAAAGAWLGLEALPVVMLTAAGSGLVTVLLARVAGVTVTRTTRVPFGPFLALAFFAVWLAG